jgi:hypothetical protein
MALLSYGVATGTSCGIVVMEQPWNCSVMEYGSYGIVVMEQPWHCSVME